MYLLFWGREQWKVLRQAMFHDSNCRPVGVICQCEHQCCTPALYPQAYDWADTYRNRTVWVPPAPLGAVGTGNSVPWLGVAEFLGINPYEAAEHLALGMWTHTHPNAVPDPKVSQPLFFVVDTGQVVLTVSSACVQRSHKAGMRHMPDVSKAACRSAVLMQQR